jgi:serine/threonine-protein kinase HipA
VEAVGTRWLISAVARIFKPPLYDVASVLPYPDKNIQKVALSMKLAGEYRLHNITLHHWGKLATDRAALDPDAMTAPVHTFAAQLGDHVSEIRRRMTEEGVDHPIIARLGDALVARAASCRQLLCS